jgi:hypothetical protein
MSKHTVLPEQVKHIVGFSGGIESPQDHYFGCR